MTDAAETQLLPRERVLFEGYPAVVPGLWAALLLVVTLGLGWFYLILRSRSVSYRVSTRRIIIERGLLSKRLEQVDTFRIRDYVVDRPFTQRMFGTGNIHLVTMDKTTPLVDIKDIKTNVLDLYERLRMASEVERGVAGVRVVEES